MPFQTHLIVLTRFMYRDIPSEPKVPVHLSKVGYILQWKLQWMYGIYFYNNFYKWSLQPYGRGYVCTPTCFWMGLPTSAQCNIILSQVHRDFQPTLYNKGNVFQVWRECFILFTWCVSRCTSPLMMLLYGQKLRYYRE
jgi:hypothetical protein